MAWPLTSRRKDASATEEERAGAAEAFAAEVLPHAETLLRAALRLSGGEAAAAEDAVQETLLRAWRGFGGFQRGSNARAWLFAILMNFLRKGWQRAARRPEVVSLDEHLESHEVAAPAPATTEPADSEVFAALERLPAEQRAVLVLNVVEGFTCQDVAGMLDLPIGTVMSRLGRARLAMRGHLGHLRPPPADALLPGPCCSP